ncbi:MAG: ABC transporter ATP-binding protein [Candidatus Lambdaproteobacteria bacterium]|nr:ABC transporter ATP-binding protein [Candidatus Lambdaproteobacteria bacterium]
MLEVEGVSKHFGGLQALQDVSFQAPAGAVTAIIGPNGAGKSTLLDCLTGLTDMDRGRVLLRGAALGKGLLARLVEVGIARTFQNLRLFPSLSVLEHVLLARHTFVRTARARAAGRGLQREACLELLARVGLAGKARHGPDALAYGEKRRLEIARALATEPHLLLLDEPAAGANAAEQQALGTIIENIAAEGTAVVLVEHHIELVGRLARSVVVLNFGQVVVTGTIGEVRAHPEVISAYLGTATH